MNNARSKDDLPPSPPALKAESEQEKEMQKMRKVGGGRDISYIYDHLPGVCYACLSLFWGNDLMRERIDFCLLALGA